MYQYYLLGHKLLGDDKTSRKAKRIMKHNTFILAIDGDVDFEPKAVRLLLDLMLRDKTVGAACGRIHPVGAGTRSFVQIYTHHQDLRMLYLNWEEQPTFLPRNTIALSGFCQKRQMTNDRSNIDWCFLSSLRCSPFLKYILNYRNELVTCGVQ